MDTCDFREPPFSGTVVKACAISAGGYNTCVIACNTGQVACWGDNSHGELGIGNTANVGTASGQMGNNLQSVALPPGTSKTRICFYGHAADVRAYSRYG